MYLQNLLKLHFRPEFLNRLDEIIMFKPLEKSAINGIVDLLLKELNSRIADKELVIKLSEAARTAIIDAGYDPVYGARPLKRYMQKNIETLVAKSILENKHHQGDTIVIDYDESKHAFLIQRGSVLFTRTQAYDMIRTN